MTVTIARPGLAASAVGSSSSLDDFGYGNVESRARGRVTGMVAFLKFAAQAAELTPEKRPTYVAAKLKVAREKTTFKQRQITRIVNGINASKATGTIEFLLNDDVVKFHLTGQSGAVAPAKAAEKVNPWDKVLKNGKAKPVLTILKKVP
jgi:hypothetical protein